MSSNAVPVHGLDRRRLQAAHRYTRAITVAMVHSVREPVGRARRAYGIHSVSLVTHRRIGILGNTPCSTVTAGSGPHPPGSPDRRVGRHICDPAAARQPMPRPSPAAASGGVVGRLRAPGTAARESLRGRVSRRAPAATRTGCAVNGAAHDWGRTGNRFVRQALPPLLHFSSSCAVIVRPLCVLAEVPWSRFGHAYGSGSDVPGLLARVRSADAEVARGALRRLGAVSSTREQSAPLPR